MIRSPGSRITCEKWRAAGCKSWWIWARSNAPGVGYEFETADFRSTNPLCTTVQETIDLKWKRITQIGRNAIGGRFWELTVDATLSMPGVLVAEVILDGTQLRVGDLDPANTAANTANEPAFAIVQSRDNPSGTILINLSCSLGLIQWNGMVSESQYYKTAHMDLGQSGHRTRHRIY